MNSLNQKVEALRSVHFILLFLFGILISCQPQIESSEQFIKLSDSLILEPGFAINEKLSGFCSSKDGTKYLYFANLTSKKAIGLFDLNGNKIKEINLDSLLKIEPYIEDIELFSMDTIIAISQYSNRIYILNDSFQIIRKIEMNPILNFPSDNSRHLFTSNSSNAVFDHKRLIFPMYANVDHPEDWSKDRIGLVRHLCINNWNNDQFLIINDVFSDTINFQTGLKIYRKISPKDSLNHFLNDFKSYCIGTDFIYAYSLFSNQIFKLDKTTLKLKDQITIKTNKTSIGAKHIPYANLKIGESGLEQHYNFETSGTISSLHYNKENNHIYALISKANERGFFMREGYGFWLIIVYDSAFNKLGEFEFSGKDYEPHIFPYEFGFYLRKKIKTEYPRFPTKFHYFEYE